MITGLVLIICGILIAVFPKLLAIIVAAVLILTGVLVMLVAHDFRKHGQFGEIRAVRYIVRH